MITAIEKAWQENLQESKEHQWKSKGDLIDNCCPYGEYKLNIKGFNSDDELCSHYSENCTKCWNSEIEETKQDSMSETVKQSTLTINQHSIEITENNQRVKSAHHRIDGIYFAAGIFGAIAGWVANFFASIWKGGHGG